QQWLMLREVSVPLDDPAVAHERLHELDPSARAALVADLAEPWRAAARALLGGPDPQGAIQRALSLPRPLLAEAPSRVPVDLLHQGSYPTRLMGLLDRATVAQVLADQPRPEPSLAAQFEEAIARYGAAEGIARIRTRSYLRLA